ncbi:phage tail terminator-like protein [Pseudomonas gorinensis]
MSDKIIRSLFEGRLKAWAAGGVAALPILRGRRFRAAANGSTYLRAYLLPANTTSEDLEGKRAPYMSIFQMSVVTKADIGRGAAEGIADEIAALFPNNLGLTKTNFTVYVRSPMSPGSPSRATRPAALPLSIQYRADTTT